MRTMLGGGRGGRGAWFEGEGIRGGEVAGDGRRPAWGGREVRALEAPGAPARLNSPEMVILGSFFSPGGGGAPVRDGGEGFRGEGFEGSVNGPVEWA